MSPFAGLGLGPSLLRLGWLGRMGIWLPVGLWRIRILRMKRTLRNGIFMDVIIGHSSKTEYINVIFKERYFKLFNHNLTIFCFKLLTNSITVRKFYLHTWKFPYVTFYRRVNLANLDFLLLNKNAFALHPVFFV